MYSISDVSVTYICIIKEFRKKIVTYISIMLELKLKVCITQQIFLVLLGLQVERVNCNCISLSHFFNILALSGRASKLAIHFCILVTDNSKCIIASSAFVLTQNTPFLFYDKTYLLLTYYNHISHTLLSEDQQKHTVIHYLYLST